MADVGQKILELRKLRDQAHKTRADADAALRLGEQQLTETETAIRNEGVEPDTCEQELAQLENKLAVTVDDLLAKTQNEIAAYNNILVAAKAAGLR